MNADAKLSDHAYLMSDNLFWLLIRYFNIDSANLRAFGRGAESASSSFVQGKWTLGEAPLTVGRMQDRGRQSIARAARRRFAGAGWG